MVITRASGCSSVCACSLVEGWDGASSVWGRGRKKQSPPTHPTPPGVTALHDEAAPILAPRPLGVSFIFHLIPQNLVFSIYGRDSLGITRLQALNQWHCLRLVHVYKALFMPPHA